MEEYNPHWAIASVLDEAKDGNAQAQFAAAEHLWKGRRTAQDFPMAVFWYEKAARAGHPQAQCAVAYAYATGKGIEPSAQKAFYWYATAAQANDLRALRGLAACYAQGFGTEKSIEKAYALLERAINLQQGAAMDTRGFDRW
jgi:TPR repeat protein